MKTTAPNQRRMVTELFNHTADLGLECSGSSMADLLERAGEMLAGCIVDRRRIRVVEERAVTAEGGDPERHALIREIKAVTYHGVTIEESRGMLTARVVLDV